MGRDPDPASRTRAHRFKPWLVAGLVLVLGVTTATVANVLATSVAGDAESISATDEPVRAPSTLVDEFREKLAPRRVSSVEPAGAGSATPASVPGHALNPGARNALGAQMAVRTRAPCGPLCAGLGALAAFSEGPRRYGR